MTLAPAQPNAPPVPMIGYMAGFRRFSVAEYHWLIQQGFLSENDPIELVRGYLVQKMPKNPPHDSTVTRCGKILDRILPPGWTSRTQCAITLTQSEPEPDGVIVRGDERTFDSRHPGPAEFGVVIEVADATLASDRADKLPMYAEEGIPVFWIINLQKNIVEVYENPMGDQYRTRTDYRRGDQMPLSLDGHMLLIDVSGLLP